jgi:hypothetical protein
MQKIIEYQLIRICWLAVAAQIIATGPVVAQSTQAAGTPALMDRRKEIALALSACPPSVASKAAVYVLGQSGYVKVRDSQNGLYGNRPALAAHQSGATVHGRGGCPHISPAHAEGSRVTRQERSFVSIMETTI